MSEGDADSMAEMPEAPQKVAAGSGEDMGQERQAFAVRKEKTLPRKKC